jgi:hypothetical protein
MNDLSRKILNSALDRYLEPGQFNGLGVATLNGDDDIQAVRDLIVAGKLDLVRGDGHPNPHIKAFEADPVEIQLEKIETGGLAGCLYPTPAALIEIGAGKDEIAPFTKELMQGAPQFTFRSFDLRVLEWYRNDPRYDYVFDDIEGRISQRAGTQVADRGVIQNRLVSFEFGFAYDKARNRAIAAFFRYLHVLLPEQQIEMKKHELDGEYCLHPGYYRKRILGDFHVQPSIYGAFIKEKQVINGICKLMGKPKLFNKDFRENPRPRGFGILIRPTKKEFRDFALLLDQLLSDDLNRNFFKGDVELNRTLTDEAGNKVVQPIGTIALLEEWINLKFNISNPEPLKEMFSNFRAVRKVRQNPAHKVEDDEFDQKYIVDQRDVIKKAYDAVRTLRMVLEIDPAARNYKVPGHIRNGEVWID